MIEAVIIFALGFYLGHKLATLFHVAAFKKILDELGIKEQDMRQLARRAGLEHRLPPESTKESGLEEIHIKLEQHQGQIYAFRMDNDGFLGQGKDRDSLIQHLQQRMMNVRLIVDEGGELIAKTVDTQPK
jgi:hypothetical protein